MERRTTQLTSKEVQEWTNLLHRLKHGDVAGVYAKTNNNGEVWIDIPEHREHQKIGGVRNTELDT